MWGTLFGLGSALSWASANVSIKGASAQLGPWSALLWAQLIGGAMALGAAMAFEPVPLSIPFGSLLVAALAACAAYGGLFAALEAGQLVVVAPIISTWAVVSVALSVAFGAPPPAIVAATGIVMVVAGNIVLARSSTRRGGDTPPAAIAWAAVSAVGFGVMVPMIDALGEQTGRLWAIPLVWGLELAIAIVPLWRAGLLPRRPVSGTEWWIAARSGVFEVGGFVCLSVGMTHAPLSVLSPVSSLSTAASVALGMFLLGERLRPSAIVGAACASVGVVLVNL